MSAGASLQDLNVEHQCELLPDRVFVHKPIDNLALAYELGCAGTTLMVYDRMRVNLDKTCKPGSGKPQHYAHYYTFIAEECQPILLQLAVPAHEYTKNIPLRMYIVGPGLPRRRPMPRWSTPGDGKRNAKAKKGQLQTDLVTQTQFRLLREIQFTAPVRGRFVLVIETNVEHRIDVPYRILLSGESGCQWKNIFAVPYQWLQTNLFAWKKEAFFRLMTVLLGILVIIGFWHLRWRKKVAARGSFVG
ncbi:MAG TPA: hypothetical protein VHR86_10215 [Armatimonadota bacterium]|nr:hypothetical protein [Armatimonadota bacterium]